MPEAGNARSGYRPVRLLCAVVALGPPRRRSSAWSPRHGASLDTAPVEKSPGSTRTKSFSPHKALTERSPNDRKKRLRRRERGFQFGPRIGRRRPLADAPPSIKTSPPVGRVAHPRGECVPFVAEGDPHAGKAIPLVRLTGNGRTMQDSARTPSSVRCNYATCPPCSTTKAPPSIGSSSIFGLVRLIGASGSRPNRKSVPDVLDL